MKIETSRFALVSRDAFDSVSCLDGNLTLRDIARAAGVPVKRAYRAVCDHADKMEDARRTGDSATLSMELWVNPSEQKRADLAPIVAERLGLRRRPPRRSQAPAGRSIPIRKLARVSEDTGVPIDRLRPGMNEAERMMAMGHSRGHLYRDGQKGRSLTTHQEPGQGHVMIAMLECSGAGCRRRGEVRLRELPGPGIVDRKFRQAGWDIDPHRCPDCKNPPKEDDMAQPSHDAMRAQAAMFRLLDTHFDAQKGLYDPEWSDARVAKESNLAIEAVTEFRKAGFGELKAPPELAMLSADIAALENLLQEQVQPIVAELKSLRDRVADVRRRFAA